MGQAVRRVGSELEAFCRGIRSKGWREAIRKCVPMGTPSGPRPEM